MRLHEEGKHSIYVWLGMLNFRAQSNSNQPMLGTSWIFF